MQAFSLIDVLEQFWLEFIELVAARMCMATESAQWNETMKTNIETENFVNMCTWLNITGRK